MRVIYRGAPYMRDHFPVLDTKKPCLALVRVSQSNSSALGLFQEGASRFLVKGVLCLPKIKRMRLAQA